MRVKTCYFIPQETEMRAEFNEGIYFCFNDPHRHEQEFLLFYFKILKLNYKIRETVR